ncbi:MAG: hypothetical protein DME03_21440 [Candidatus Rokuibacteriota bacterium]|nr:MAG: hypothetical protein DME03_21440 [Candidatus Rokubacteria bacterium]
MPGAAPSWPRSSELGTDMPVFCSAQHAAAWAGVCPGNNENAGKHARQGNVHLRTALVGRWAPIRLLASHKTSAEPTAGP